MPITGGQLFVDLNSLGLPHAIFDRKLRFGSSSNTIIFAVRLLNCLIPDRSKPSPLRSKNYASFVRHNLAWILNSYQRLWSVSFRWLKMVDLQGFEVQARICLQVLEGMEGLHHCGIFSWLETQWTYGLLQLLDEVLVLERLGQLRALHPEISRLIFKLSCCIGKTGSFSRIARYTISPRVVEIKNAPSLLGSLDPQLQVFSTSKGRSMHV